MDERRRNGDYGDRILAVEMQIDRLVSDAESEKGTRKRMNEHFLEKLDQVNDRLRKVEHSNWFAAGAVGVIVVIAQILFKHL